MTPDAQDLIWEQIDRAFVNLELQHRRLEYRPSKVRFSDIEDILEKHVRAIDHKVEQTYGVYCDVWALQNHLVSPEFLFVVYKKAIIPFLRLAPKVFERHFRHHAADPDFSEFTNVFHSRIAAAYAQKLHFRLRKVEERWEVRIRADAKRAEYRAKAHSAAVIPKALGNTRVTLDSAKGSARARAKALPITEAIRAIWKNHPKYKAQQMAREMDVRAERDRRLRPQSQWPKWQGCPGLWVDARKMKRSTVDSHFSRAKARRP